jgi:hypothetical protein
MSKFVNISLPPSEQAKFKAWTKKLSAENRTKCQMLIVNTTYRIARHAQMFAPVRTGFLKTSIHPVVSDDGLSGMVYTYRHYAPYVEFGTGTKVVAPADVADYAMTFKGRGIRKVNQRAQPYLFPAVRIGVKEMMTRLEQMGFKKTI